MERTDTTVIFDLDGTIYQNTVFHRDYIHALVSDTPYVRWEQDLIALTEEIFSGKHLRMNHFYTAAPTGAKTVDELASRLAGQLRPDLTYRQGLQAEDVIYLGDAWAVLALLGSAMGCLDQKRSDEVYHETRLCMERAGMLHGNPRLRASILALQQRCRVLLMSNSYQQTVEEFLRQLDYGDIFPTICYSARKPGGMVESLRRTDPSILCHPEKLISIGDHAFNDLMPIAELGGKTVWMNPYPKIETPVCDRSLATLDELASYLDTL
ncbi:MAG: HAD family hydrolase [Clostridiales bacterium]|nr:HAD family hydrolase [Clostridiales bacterium]